MPANKRKTSKGNQARTAPGVAQTQIKAEFHYVLPDDLVAQYADNLNITHTENEFILSFMQTQHPLFDPGGDLESIKRVNAVCIARLIVAPARMPLFINALSENFKRFLETDRAQPGELEKKNK